MGVSCLFLVCYDGFFVVFSPLRIQYLPVALSDIKFDAVYRILEGLVLVFFHFL